MLGHQRQIAQEDLLLDNLAGLTVYQRHLNVERHGKRKVTVQTLLLAVVRLAKAVFQLKARLFGLRPGQIETQEAVEAVNRRDLIEELGHALLVEPLIGPQLHFHKSR